MINGDTDLFVSERVHPVVGVLPPETSLVQGKRRERLLCSTWDLAKHPYKAEGEDLWFKVDPEANGDVDAPSTLQAFLRTALGEFPDRYVNVSGGFSTTLPYPTEVLKKRRIPTPYRPRFGGHDQCRGSERTCVRQYRFLRAEGELEYAKVPPWFLPEGWLDIYANEAEQD
jgi:hypothetical protein